MEENQSLLELEVDQETGTNIMEMTKWARLYAILITVVFGLCLLIFFIGWKAVISLFDPMSELNDANAASGLMMVFAIVIIIVGAILSIMLVFLFKGINGLKNGIKNKDQLSFNIGLANLRNAFAMYAVVAILGLLSQLSKLF